MSQINKDRPKFEFWSIFAICVRIQGVNVGEMQKVGVCLVWTEHPHLGPVRIEYSSPRSCADRTIVDLAEIYKFAMET